MKTTLKISLLVLSLALSASALLAQSSNDTSPTNATPPAANEQQNNNLNINLDKIYINDIYSKTYTISLSQGGLVVVSYHTNIAQYIDHSNSNPEILSQSSTSSKPGVKILNYQPLQVGKATLTFTLNNPESNVPTSYTYTLIINVTE